MIELAAVLVLLAGAVMTTTGVLPRFTVMVAGAPVPNELVQDTVMVLAPTARVTEFVEPPVELAPLTVHVVPEATVDEPSTVYATLIVAAVVFVLLAGDVTTTVGTPPRVTVTEALPEPNAFVQATVIVLMPVVRLNALVVGLVDAVPLMAQVVPDGIVVAPVTVYATLIEVAVVFVLFAGDVIAITGALPRLTTTDALPVPNELVQATAIVFAPVARDTELVDGVVVATPLTVQVVPDGIVVAPLTV